MLKNNKVRQSNLELLRIVSMLMIIMYHISLHCVRYQLTDKNSIQRMGNDYFCHPQFYKRIFLLEGIMPFGIIANAVFILISGYFLVEKGDKISVGKISKKVLLQVGFVTMILIVASTLYYTVNVPDAKTAVNFRTVTDFNSSSWFVGYYFLIIAVAGVFLNKILVRLDQKQYRNLLLTIFGIMSIGWSGAILDSLGKGLRDLTCGIFLYALGGYIKRFNPFRRIRAWALMALIGVLYALFYLSYHNFVENGIHSYIMDVASKGANSKNVSSFIQPVFGFDNYGILPIIIAIVIFELFRRIKIPSSRIINAIAGGTLMVYLMHDNEFWRCIWRERDWIKMLYNDPLHYVITLLKWTLFIFVIGIVLYFLFLGLCRFCEKCKCIILKGNKNIAEDN